MLGWVKYRAQISLLVILCIIMYVTNIYFFFTKPISDYGKMLKYRGKNIGKPIYRSISNFMFILLDCCGVFCLFFNFVLLFEHSDAVVSVF